MRLLRRARRAVLGTAVRAYRRAATLGRRARHGQHLLDVDDLRARPAAGGAAPSFLGVDGPPAVQVDHVRAPATDHRLDRGERARPARQQPRVEVVEQRGDGLLRTGLVGADEAARARAWPTRRHRPRGRRGRGRGARSRSPRRTAGPGRARRGSRWPGRPGRRSTGAVGESDAGRRVVTEDPSGTRGSAARCAGGRGGRPAGEVAQRRRAARRRPPGRHPRSGRRCRPTRQGDELGVVNAACRRRGGRGPRPPGRRLRDSAAQGSAAMSVRSSAAGSVVRMRATSRATLPVPMTTARSPSSARRGRRGRGGRCTNRPGRSPRPSREVLTRDAEPAVGCRADGVDDRVVLGGRSSSRSRDPLR